MNKLSFQTRTILATLTSFIIAGSVVAECSNGGKIRWEPNAAKVEQMA